MEVVVGGRFQWDGVYVYLQLIHVWKEKSTQFCTVIILQLKM